MVVLGIETSCDETGIALYDTSAGILAHNLHSQIKTHQQFGGVVPELASRDHLRHLVPLLRQTLQDAGMEQDGIDAVAWTAGPGLAGALLTGATFGKTLAVSLGIPGIAVHHLEAHILAAMLDNPSLAFPFTVLLVSGGHTQLLQAKAFGKYELLGDTLDDAVGEAFDKTAKLMGMPYPGGPEIAALADRTPVSNLPPFPRPMITREGLDFSFSGLKTHVLHVWQKSAMDDAMRAAIAREFQDAVVETLTARCKKALIASRSARLVVAGGVGANRALRASLAQVLQEQGGEVFFPRIEYCTDNGAMVAFAGALRIAHGMMETDLAINVRPRWPLDEL